MNLVRKFQKTPISSISEGKMLDLVALMICFHQNHNNKHENFFAANNHSTLVTSKFEL